MASVNKSAHYAGESQFTHESCRGRYDSQSELPVNELSQAIVQPVRFAESSDNSRISVTRLDECILPDVRIGQSTIACPACELDDTEQLGLEPSSPVGASDCGIWLLDVRKATAHLLKSMSGRCRRWRLCRQNLTHLAAERPATASELLLGRSWYTRTRDTGASRFG